MTELTPAERRLATIPWDALDGLGALLDAPLEKILAGESAERVLDRLLRDHADFTSDQRAVCAESLFGVGLWRRRLRAQLGPTATPRQLLAGLVNDLGAHSGAAQLLDVTLPAAAPLTDWRDRFSVPDWLADVLLEEAGDAAEAFAAALNAPGPVCLRVNRLTTTRAALARALAAESIETRPGEYARDALVVTSRRPNLFGSACAGQFEVQDEGSQLIAELLGAGEGAEVLDLCAGAGGKSLQLASIVGPKGVVHATDVALARLERLRHRASHAAATIRIHGRLPPPTLRVPFILVDAPCSELGALRRGPDLRWRIDPGTFAPLPALQRDLLERAVAHLSAHGRVVYATCTLRREENEEVVASFLAAHDQFHVVKPSMAEVLCTKEGFLKVSPRRHGTDGFFAAILQRG